jgi:small-conductance mechanosensitive channel
MLQDPIPTRPQAPPLELPFPEGLGRWRDLYLYDFSQKLVVFLVVAAVMYLLARLARQVISRQVPDINRRHTMRKWVSYGAGFLLMIVAVALFADALTGLGTIFAVILAGVAIALQDLLKSVVGWIYISGRTGVEVGSRVEVEGVVGDVIDIGVLKTTLLEIGNLVYGRQSTGRLVTVPNSRMIASSVFMSTRANPFVWQEMRVVITFESDWVRAEEIMRKIADELHAEVAPQLEQGFTRMEKRYAFKYGATTPIVYLSLAENGVELDLRLLVPVRRRRGSVDQITRRILKEFASEPNVRIAYPTYRIYRAGEQPPE